MSRDSGLIFWATLNMPRYLLVSTQGIMWSAAVVIWLHFTGWPKKASHYQIITKLC